MYATIQIYKVNDIKRLSDLKQRSEYVSDCFIHIYYISWHLFALYVQYSRYSVLVSMFPTVLFTLYYVTLADICLPFIVFSRYIVGTFSISVYQ